MKRFQYIADLLRQTQKKSIKQLILQKSTIIPKPVLIKLLSKARKIMLTQQFKKLLTEHQIQNKYLFAVMLTQHFNKKLKCGGYLAKVCKNINQNLFQKIISQERQVWGWWAFQQRFIGQKDSTIKHLYKFTYEQYKQILQSQFGQELVVQGKSSALPVYLLTLNIECNSVIIDATSAPGNKSLQLYKYTKGIIYSFQKNSERYKTLVNRVKKYKAQERIRTINKDFLEVDCRDFDEVDLVVVDPTCSGSGMVRNVTHFYQLNEQFQKFCQHAFQELNQRKKQHVYQLQKRQLKLLEHSVLFNPKRISYSTCSIYKQENQMVISEFLKKCDRYIELGRRNLPKDLIRGFEGKSLRAVPLKSDGFFVSILCRKD